MSWPSLRASDLGAVSPAGAQAPNAAELARGKYIFGATGGCGCHTQPKQPVNSGGRKYDGPFGTVYSSNITPDPQDRDRLLDRRPDHHGHPAGTPAQWRAPPAGASLHRLQRHGRGRPQGPSPISAACPRSTARTSPRRSPCPSSSPCSCRPGWPPSPRRRRRRPTAPPRHSARRVPGPRRRPLWRMPYPAHMTMATDNSRFLAGNPKGPEDAEVPNITPDKTPDSTGRTTRSPTISPQATSPTATPRAGSWRK